MTLRDFLIYYLIGGVISACAILVFLLTNTKPRSLFGLVLNCLAAMALSCAWPILLPVFVIELLKGRPEPKYDEET